MATDIYTTNARHIVSQLRKARKESQLTQGEVAEKLGQTQSYISKVEAGQVRIDVVQLQRFAKLYKKNLSYFID